MVKYSSLGGMAQLVEHSLHMRGVTGSSPVVSTKCVGRKVFCLFDPFLHIFSKKLAIFAPLDFQGPFFIPENSKKTLPTHIDKVG